MAVANLYLMCFGKNMTSRKVYYAHAGRNDQQCKPIGCRYCMCVSCIPLPVTDELFEFLNV